MVYVDWGTVTEEEFLSSGHNPLWVYLAAKIMAETMAWKFARENPTVDLATSKYRLYECLTLITRFFFSQSSIHIRTSQRTIPTCNA